MSTSDVWKDKLVLPPLNKSIYIDIETDVYSSRIWMIGAKNNGQYYQYTASDWEGEIGILNQFGKLLEQFPGYALINYSRTNFDFRHLWNAAKKHKITSLIKSMSYRPWIDFATILKRCYKPSINSMSLKALGYYHDYQFAIDGMNGFELSTKYANDIKKNGSISNSLLDTAEKYNKDDLDLIEFLISKFSAHVVIYKDYVKKCTNQSDLLSEIKSNLREFKQSKTQFRVTVSQDHELKIQAILLRYGIPLPSIYRGVKTSRLVWNSNLARERFGNLLNDLNEGEKI